MHFSVFSMFLKICVVEPSMPHLACFFFYFTHVALGWPIVLTNFLVRLAIEAATDFYGLWSNIYEFRS